MEDNFSKKQQRTETPKFFRILFSDYSLGIFLFLIVLVIAIGIGLYFGDGLILAAIISLSISVILIILFFYRLSYIKSLLKSGIEAKGEITKIYIALPGRTGSSVRFNYEYKRVPYKYHSQVYKYKIRRMEVGMPITLLLNSKNHKRAIIKDLFYPEQ